jgi:hypothetical protein
MKEVLGYFNKRWLIAGTNEDLLGRLRLTMGLGKYLEALENIKEDYPLTILPIHGSYVSATMRILEHLPRFHNQQGFHDPTTETH